MRPPPRPGILLVATRELRWMLRDRVALFLAIGMPLLAFALLALTFSNAVIRDLRVSVVDADRTPTSMIYVQAVSSTPTVIVAERADDLTGAMHAIRSGDAIAAVYIPPHFESDLIARKRPQIVVFYNRQFFTPGNNAASAISSALTAATATLPSPMRSASFKPGSLVVEQYVLTNPALNFAQFLLRAVMPTVLHMVTAIAAGYAVGSEFATRSVSAWLKLAGGSPLAALIGKLAPLFAIFILMMSVVAAIIHSVFQVPFRGDSVIMGAAACLLLIAYLAVGALFQLLARNLALGLSLTAIFCSPAFGFAGVGFPLFAMNGFAHVWGSLLPLRWYIQILFDQAVRGLPPSVSAWPFITLGSIAIILFALAWLRLGAIAKKARSPFGKPVEVKSPPSGPGIGATMFDEYRRVLNDRGVFGLMVLAPLIYGALYPQPYLGQVLRDIPVAVVDQDGSELSRELVQTLNADEAVSVNVRADTLAQAQAALARREVFAILEIPEGTEREVLKGNKARIAAYVDFGLFSSLQPHAAGDEGSRRRSHGANRRPWCPRRREPRPCGADSKFAGRGRNRAAIQPDRRLRELRRSRRLRADSAADAAHGFRHPWRGRIRGGRRCGQKATWRRACDLRSIISPSLPHDARSSPLYDCSAALLWLFDSRAPVRHFPDGHTLPSRE